MNINLNRGGLIGALALAVYSGLWVFLSLRGLGQDNRLVEMASNAFITGIVVGGIVGNSIWTMVLRARGDASSEQGSAKIDA